VRAQIEQPLPNNLTANARPIEMQTENGFSIVRRWESERRPPPTDGVYPFIVRNPTCEEREIIVTVADDVVTQTQFRTRGRIQLGSTFWICCAERRLANHLWKNDDFPSNNRLRIEELERSDVMLALRWGRL
jgi:hypothetical protein